MLHQNIPVRLIPHNVIVCSPMNVDELQKRYPKRRVVADPECPDTWAYYEAPNGRLRHYEVKTRKVYEAVYDANGFLTGKLRRIG